MCPWDHPFEPGGLTSTQPESITSPMAQVGGLKSMEPLPSMPVDNHNHSYYRFKVKMVCSALNYRTFKGHLGADLSF